VVAGCYASPLEDCGGKLSKEHYISEAILKRLNSASPAFGIPDGELRVTLPNLPPGEPRRLPPSALTMRILCKRHNSALSALDSEAGRLFATIDTRAEEFKANPDLSIPRISLFSGHDIERWLLKVLGAATTFGEKLFPDRPTVTDFPRPWLEILFGLRDFEPSQGLYIRRSIGKAREIGRQTTFGGIGAQGRFVGRSMDPRGETLNLIMLPTEESGRRFLGDDHAYRPFEIHDSDGVSEKSIVFSWEGPGDYGTIHIASRNLPDTLYPQGPKTQ